MPERSRAGDRRSDDHPADGGAGGARATRRRPSPLVAVTVLALVAVAAVACAKVEESGTATRERQVAYVAAKLIPAGKTIRAAQADGSIEANEVPADVLAEAGDDALQDPDAIECLVAGRPLPAGALLRRSMFVDPGELGLATGLTDGTTVDPEC